MKRTNQSSSSNEPSPKKRKENATTLFTSLDNQQECCSEDDTNDNAPVSTSTTAITTPPPLQSHVDTSLDNQQECCSEDDTSDNAPVSTSTTAITTPPPLQSHVDTWEPLELPTDLIQLFEENTKSFAMDNITLFEEKAKQVFEYKKKYGKNPLADFSLGKFVATARNKEKDGRDYWTPAHAEIIKKYDIKSSLFTEKYVFQVVGIDSKSSAFLPANLLNLYSRKTTIASKLNRTAAKKRCLIFKESDSGVASTRKSENSLNMLRFHKFQHIVRFRLVKAETMEVMGRYKIIQIPYDKIDQKDNVDEADDLSVDNELDVGIIGYNAIGNISTKNSTTKQNEFENAASKITANATNATAVTPETVPMCLPQRYVANADSSTASFYPNGARRGHGAQHGSGSDQSYTNRAIYSPPYKSPSKAKASANAQAAIAAGMTEPQSVNEQPVAALATVDAQGSIGSGDGGAVSVSSGASNASGNGESMTLLSGSSAEARSDVSPSVEYTAVSVLHPMINCNDSTMDCVAPVTTNNATEHIASRETNCKDTDSNLENYEKGNREIVRIPLSYATNPKDFKRVKAYVTEMLDEGLETTYYYSFIEKYPEFEERYLKNSLSSAIAAFKHQYKKKMSQHGRKVVGSDPQNEAPDAQDKNEDENKGATGGQAGSFTHNVGSDSSIGSISMSSGNSTTAAGGGYGGIAAGMTEPQSVNELDFDIRDPFTTPIVPAGTVPVCDINAQDVLFARGGKNRMLRSLVQEFQTKYSLCKRNKEKQQIVRTIVLIIRKRGGRFLQKDEKDGAFYEVGDDKAEQKTRRALLYMNSQNDHPIFHDGSGGCGSGGYGGPQQGNNMNSQNYHPNFQNNFDGSGGYGGYGRPQQGNNMNSQNYHPNFQNNFDGSGGYGRPQQGYNMNSQNYHPNFQSNFDGSGGYGRPQQGYNMNSQNYHPNFQNNFDGSGGYGRPQQGYNMNSQNYHSNFQSSGGYGRPQQGYNMNSQNYHSNFQNNFDGSGGYGSGGYGRPEQGNNMNSQNNALNMHVHSPVCEFQREDHDSIQDSENNFDTNFEVEDEHIKTSQTSATDADADADAESQQISSTKKLVSLFKGIFGK